MRLFAASVSLIALAMAPPLQVAVSQPRPTAGEVRYNVSDTPIGVLLDDPAARAVLEKHVPSVVRGGRVGRSATLKSIQGYALGVLTDKVLGDIDAELARITPKPGALSAAPRITTDEARVRRYKLPDPLILSSGEPVRDAQTWFRVRRPEIVGMFETLQYGRAPVRPPAQRFEVFDKGTAALGGKAIRKQVTIRVSEDPNAPSIHLVEYIPAAAKQPVPMLLTIGFTAPSAMFDDPGIRPGQVWDPRTKTKVPATGSPTGKMKIDRFLDAGIGVAAFYYGDLDPDFAGGYPLGIRAHLDRVDEAKRAPDAWGSISAWAWSLSRVQDYLETDRSVDSKRVAIFGASRLGKTVLWAAARDQRFAAVISCCSGKIGAALMRRNFGGSIGGENEAGSAHWTAPNFRKFFDNEDALPMDSHMLLAAIAPRPVLLQTGKYDHAADPRGEFLAAVAAGPVYRLLGKEDLGTAQWPPAAPIINDLGYHMNDGGHGIAEGDWDVYLAFLKKHLRP